MNPSFWAGVVERDRHLVHDPQRPFLPVVSESPSVT